MHTRCSPHQEILNRLSRLEEKTTVNEKDITAVMKDLSDLADRVRSDLATFSIEFAGLIDRVKDIVARNQKKKVPKNGGMF